MLHGALARNLGIRGVVEKRREVMHVGQTRVHTDDVSGPGVFLELEEETVKKTSESRTGMEARKIGVSSCRADWM